MTLSSTISDLKDAIVSLISTHEDITGSSSTKGHTQAGGAPQSIGDSLSAGTDNGYYARADHVHTAQTSHIKDTNTYSNIGTVANDTQATINAAIDNNLGTSISLITGTVVQSNNLIFTINGSSFSTYSTTPFTSTGTIIVDWGDDNTETYTTGALTHTYTTSGTYTITIKGQITALNDECFKNCTSLIDITIPTNITSLGEDCFNGCTGLTNIIIPSNITSIDANCFNGCTNLTNISFEKTVPATVQNINAWTNIPTTCIIYVPINNLAAYTTAVNYPSTSTYTYIGATRKSIDSVRDGDLRTVTSNAVYDYMTSQLGDISSIINGTGSE